MKGEEFTCAACGGIFHKGRPDGEAAAEFAKLEPDQKLEDAVVVCDDCFNKIYARLAADN